MKKWMSQAPISQSYKWVELGLRDSQYIALCWIRDLRYMQQ